LLQITHDLYNHENDPGSYRVRSSNTNAAKSLLFLGIFLPNLLGYSNKAAVPCLFRDQVFYMSLFSYWLFWSIHELVVWLQMILVHGPC